MQGTIATFDPDTRSGTLLLDDGTPLSFGAEAFQRSGLRLLRLGQRVTVESDATGVVRRVLIPGVL
ncbi:cold-shock protein [Actinoplanes sp. CA-252034]|uniref:cold-shock protein n=1 Tax=Actinoplanes sp. CA-252034 TaxID=3239906 RepID=UPI003D9881AB